MQGYDYIFKSERLAFRNWKSEDVLQMAAISANERVMQFFPTVQTAAETEAFIARMQESILNKGYGYFAVDRRDTPEFIGFIGISDKTFESDFTPCVDIGWRLSPAAWNLGFATEGAKRCLEYAFNELKIDKVVSMAPRINVKSEGVMKKIGMTWVRNFDHPLLLTNERLKECVLYEKLPSKVNYK